MKPLFILLCLGSCLQAFSQSADDKAALAKQQKIAALVARETDSLKKVLTRKKLSAADAEFTLDTFRIERFSSHSLKDEMTTVSIGETTRGAIERYDSLLNKYYKKLSALLTPQNKATLVQAQKSWLAFRDNEMKLCETIYADTGSSGLLNIAGFHLTLIRTRVNQLFDYYELLAGGY